MASGKNDTRLNVFYGILLLVSVSLTGRGFVMDDAGMEEITTPWQSLPEEGAVVTTTDAGDEESDDEDYRDDDSGDEEGEVLYEFDPEDLDADNVTEWGWSMHGAHGHSWRWSPDNASVWTTWSWVMKDVKKGAQSVGGGFVMWTGTPEPAMAWPGASWSLLGPSWTLKWTSPPPVQVADEDIPDGFFNQSSWTMRTHYGTWGYRRDQDGSWGFHVGNVTVLGDASGPGEGLWQDVAADLIEEGTVIRTARGLRRVRQVVSDAEETATAPDGDAEVVPGDSPSKGFDVVRRWLRRLRDLVLSVARVDNDDDGDGWAIPIGSGTVYIGRKVANTIADWLAKNLLRAFGGSNADILLRPQDLNESMLPEPALFTPPPNEDVTKGASEDELLGMQGIAKPKRAAQAQSADELSKFQPVAAATAATAGDAEWVPVLAGYRQRIRSVATLRSPSLHLANVTHME